jgi:hypothetical protein
MTHIYPIQKYYSSFIHLDTFIAVVLKSTSLSEVLAVLWRMNMNNYPRLAKYRGAHLSFYSSIQLRYT